MLRICVYTVIVGDYDYLRPIQQEEGVSYLVFTDKPGVVTAPWRFMRMPPRNGLVFRRWSRLPKLAPHRYLPPHDVSIWVDANLRFRAPFRDWALDQLRTADLAVHRHPFRDCTYLEADRCLELRFDHAEVIQSHVRSLDASGFPRGIGLAENCFMLRRNTPAIRKLNELWLKSYMAGSQRDQLSFMPCVWKTGTPIWFIGQNSRENAIYVQRRHLKDRVVKS